MALAYEILGHLSVVQELAYLSVFPEKGTC